MKKEFDVSEIVERFCQSDPVSKEDLKKVLEEIFKEYEKPKEFKYRL